MFAINTNNCFIQISKKGFITADETVLKKYKEEFEVVNCILLPQFICQDLVSKMLSLFEKSEVFENEHVDNENKKFASDLTVRNNLLQHFITFSLSDKKLFNAIEYITGCPEIKSFNCRIYINNPKSNHYLDWHDDLQDSTRLVGVSINLSQYKYSGGSFQIRKKSNLKILRTIECGNLGDMHVFKISSSLEHRVTETSGDYARIAAAGWFVT